MNATIHSLRRVATLPLSIIIVGVGSADFENMKILDDDDGSLALKRDCVQVLKKNFQLMFIEVHVSLFHFVNMQIYHLLHWLKILWLKFLNSS